MQPPAAGPSVLVVAERAETRAALAEALDGENLKRVEAESTDVALALAAGAVPDVVVICRDEGAGAPLDLLRAIRDRAPRVGTVVVGADAGDAATWLDLGADDFVAEPSWRRELAARIRAVHRRARPPVFDALDFGELVIYPGARQVTVGGEQVEVPHKEFDLLVYLASRPGRVASRARILGEVWGSGDWSDASLTEHVRRLRRRIEDDPKRPRWIVSVRGVGYRFDRRH